MALLDIRASRSPIGQSYATRDLVEVYLWTTIEAGSARGRPIAFTDGTVRVVRAVALFPDGRRLFKFDDHADVTVPSCVLALSAYWVLKPRWRSSDDRDS